MRTDGMCPRCGENPRPRGKSGKTQGRFRPYCGPCGLERKRELYVHNPERARRSHLRQKFGISPEQYREIEQAQGGMCRLCGKSPKTRQLAVDHDHTTGSIRGLLCYRCNTGLGALGDDPEGLQRALDYVKENRAIKLV
jgi:hypothetical protein